MVRKYSKRTSRRSSYKAKKHVKKSIKKKRKTNKKKKSKRKRRGGALVIPYQSQDPLLGVLKEDPEIKQLPNEHVVERLKDKTVEAPSDMKLGDTAADLAADLANNVSGLASSFTNFFK